MARRAFAGASSGRVGSWLMFESGAGCYQADDLVIIVIIVIVCYSDYSDYWTYQHD